MAWTRSTMRRRNLLFLDAHEGLRQHQAVAGRQQAGGIIQGVGLGKTRARI